MLRSSCSKGRGWLYLIFNHEEPMRIETLMDALPTRYTPADRELIQRAFRVAEEAHKDQLRASGEPYVNHCLAVALILAE